MLPAWSEKYNRSYDKIYESIFWEEDSKTRKFLTSGPSHKTDLAETTREDVRTTTLGRMHSVVSENTSMTIERLRMERHNLLQQCNNFILSTVNKSNIALIMYNMMVRAAGTLNAGSSTETIDVNELSQRSAPVIQKHAEIADIKGRLYCVNGVTSTAYWLKTVALAEDLFNCNVILMTTDKGVILKTIKSIKAGEPLKMWFTEHILAMLNMPILKLTNIQGKSRYICHICNNIFEYPNPLKLHIALNCNRLENNHIWTLLAEGFENSLRMNRSHDSYLPLFTFKLTSSTTTTTLPIKELSPILTEPRYIDTSMRIDEKNDALNQTSPLSLTQLSSNSSSTQISPSSNRLSPPYLNQQSSNLLDQLTVENVASRYSAFKPYVNQESRSTYREISSYDLYSSAVQSERIAADMEMIATRLAKTKNGHECYYCGKLYTRKYGLKIHIRTHTGYKPLKCQICRRAFGDPSNLNKHIRLHAEGDTPYKCNVCGKMVVRRRDLERHMKSRHQQGVDNNSEPSSDV